MGNVVKLYYTGRTDSTRWELLPNKLLIVEHIEDYLATKTPLTINNFQYVKNELEIGINVDLSQTYSQPLTSSSFKYVSVQNDNELIHYYFVKKVIWRSKSAVRLELVMDVLNTFKEGTDYVFKANSKINREHKSRYIAKAITFHMEYENEGTNGTIAVGDYVNLKDSYGNIVFNFKITALADDSVNGSINNFTSLEDIIEAVDEAKQYGLHMSIYKNPSNFRDILLGDIDWDFDIYRNIDDVPENINPVLICDNTIAEVIKHPKSVLRGDWYLLYRNTNDPDPNELVNPVECYLIPDKQINTAYGYIANGRLIPSFMAEGNYYIFQIDSGQTWTMSDGHTFGYVSGASRYIMFTKAGGKISATFFDITSSVLSIRGNYDDLDYATISSVPAYYSVQTNSTLINVAFLTSISYDQTFNNSGTENKLDPITALDRTDAKNIKLIKLPYCPYDFSVSGSTIQVSADWDFVSLTQSGGGIINCFKLVDLHTKLEGTLETEYDLNPYEDLYIGSKSSLNPQKTENRRTNYYYESKLYNSEFCQPTFYYDSFAFKFEMESLDINQYVDKYNKCDIKFNMTSTINSKFMFTFNNYECMKGHQNYSKYLPITRNNEEVLYNSAYVNYVRSGFNYDIKAKALQSTSNALGVGLSALSVGASLLIPSAPLKVAGVVASLVSLAQSVKNAIVTEQQNENSIRQKLEQYQNQTTNVAGSDDVDLMSIYAENSLKFLEYNPRKEMNKLLFDLFFYAGYKSDRMGIPTHNNRVNFDYLECEAVIENVSSIPNECLEELINSFKNGITYLHRVERSGANTWDFSQEYENWETWLLED